MHLLSDRVNDPRLAFAGKVGLGPFWTLVQALSYVHVLQLSVNTFVSSSQHERTATDGEIYARMQMQDLIDGFNLINYKRQMTTMGCMVYHIHLDKNTFSILFQKRTICGSLVFNIFNSDCVHIDLNKLI
jgi:hypothetical protein